MLGPLFYRGFLKAWGIGISIIVLIWRAGFISRQCTLRFRVSDFMVLGLRGGALFRMFRLCTRSFRVCHNMELKVYSFAYGQSRVGSFFEYCLILGFSRGTLV